MIAHIRHAHTEYDALLAQFGDRDTARERIRSKVSAIIGAWQPPGGTEKERLLTTHPSSSNKALQVNPAHPASRDRVWQSRGHER